MRTSWSLGAWLLIAGCASAATLGLGAPVRDLVAHPTLPVVYAVLPTEVVAIDVTTASVVDREPLPDDGGIATIARDGSRLFVGLTTGHDAAVVDLPGLAVSDVLDLGLTSGPTGLALDVTRNVLHATCTGELSSVDVSTRAILRSGPPPVIGLGFSRPGLVVSASDDRLVAWPRIVPGHGGWIFTFSLASGLPEYAGENCHHVFTGPGVLVPSPDRQRFYVSAGAPDIVAELEADPTNILLRSFAAGDSDPKHLALARDGSHLYYTCFPSTGVRVVDLAKGLVIERIATTRSAQDLALSANDTILSVVVDDAARDPTVLEIFDVASRPPLLGGVRLRPIDSVTGTPIRGYLDTRASTTLRRAGLVDRSGAQGLGALTPGAHVVYLNGTIPLDASVVAGEWTDLGDVVVTWPARQDDLCITPPLIPGTTMDVRIHGAEIPPGSVATTARAAVEVVSSSRLAWNLMRATVNVAADAPLGSDESYQGNHPNVTAPDGYWEGAEWCGVAAPLSACAADTAEPAAVEDLRLARSMTDVAFRWSPVLVDSVGQPEAVVAYDIWAASRPTLADVFRWREAAATTLSTSRDIPDLGRLVFFQVRARDCSGLTGP